jgi:pimeloyl-ACP methyl ester carboxylesterase
LLSRHDIVLVGYRGVDGPARLDTPGLRKALRGVGGDLLSQASRDSLRCALQADAMRLQQAGYDLDGYNLQEVIADLEQARQALGYGRIHLLSESYGTRLAQLYAWQHPQAIHRSLMIGVNPPGRFLWDPAMIDAQLAFDARLWAEDPARAEISKNLAEDVRWVVQHMPSRWLLLPIDPGKVKVMAFVMLFSRKTAPLVYDTFLAARRGDPSGLALLSLAYDWMIPRMFTWGDFIAKAFSADYLPGIDYAAQLERPESILGSPLSLLFFGSGLEWPVQPLPVEFHRAQVSNIETLLVSGSIDFSTPAEYAARELLPHLRRGRQVILPEMGHVSDFWSLQPEAALHLAATFFDTGEVDATRFHYQPAGFRVSWGFPRLAKLLLGTGVLLLLLIGAGAGRLLQYHRGRGKTTPFVPHVSQKSLTH